MGRPSRVSDVRVPGPLAPFADVYKVRLKERGYTPLTTVNELRQVAHLSRWLEEQGTGTAGLTSQGLRQFFVSRRAEVGPKGCSSQSLLLLLEVLREAGAVEAEPPLPVSSGTEAVIVSFWHYLVAERGVTSPTAVSYIFRARRFMAAHAPGGDLQGLQPSDVTSAVLAESARVSVGGVQLFVVALRAFLRFCFLEGLTERDFSGAALTMTGRRRSSLPRGVARPDAEALLGTCDRRTAIGRRDYAVILTLLRLGLRAGEVAALSLDDIDWRAGRDRGPRQGRPPRPAPTAQRRRWSGRCLPGARPHAQLLPGSVPEACGAGQGPGAGRGVVDRATGVPESWHNPVRGAPAAPYAGLRHGGRRRGAA